MLFINREGVKKWFEEAVRLDATAPSDLKEVLLRGHPNIEGFLDRMTKQLREAERINLRRGKHIKPKTFQDTVYDLTKLFMKGMEGEARRRYESDMQKIMRRKEEDKIKEFDSVLAGKPEGEFAEAGVLHDEAIDQTRQEGDTQASVEKSFQKVVQQSRN